ncbi:hypothetical protein FQZ97_567950 [compost metagenome]
MHPRRFDQRGIDIAHAGIGVDHRRCKRGNPDQEDLRWIAQAQPQDCQRDPGQRRNRAQQREDRADQGVETLAEAHEQAQRHPGGNGHQKAQEHQAQAVSDVLEQRAAGIAGVARQLYRGLPGSEWGGEARAVDQAKRRHDPPGGEGGGNGGHADGNAAARYARPPRGQGCDMFTHGRTSRPGGPGGPRLPAAAAWRCSPVPAGPRTWPARTSRGHSRPVPRARPPTRPGSWPG